MKCVVVLGALWLVMMSNINCVPMAVLNNDLSDSSEEDDSSALLDDDITTRGLARLSSAATCLVAGIEYTHGQQIYRADPCEFCLCLDGEMFCWWQDCPPAMEGPCKNQGPFSPCLTIAVAPTSKPKTIYPSTSSQILSNINSTIKKSKKSKKSSSRLALQLTTLIPTEENEQSSTHNDNTDSTTYTEEGETSETESSTEFVTSTEEPKSCIVMGQEYRVGDNLPHSTGNCLECICGQGGKITCSPHQCVPAGDDITDYRSPGPRQGNDVFK